MEARCCASNWLAPQGVHLTVLMEAGGRLIGGSGGAHSPQGGHIIVHLPVRAMLRGRMGSGWIADTGGGGVIYFTNIGAERGRI